MSTTESLSEIQWQIAHAIAQDLAKEQIRLDKEKDGILTEFKTTITYLYSTKKLTNAKGNFFKYLRTLVSHGNKVGHSGKTLEYYCSIDKICRQHIPKDDTDIYSLLQILGWAARLVKYYKDAEPVGEIAAPPVESARQAEIAEVVQSQQFRVGQVLEAVITTLKGNKVTYEILSTIKLTAKELKKAKSLSEGQTVKVEILDLKEDGNIRKVKRVDS